MAVAAITGAREKSAAVLHTCRQTDGYYDDGSVPYDIALFIIHQTTSTTTSNNASSM
jgi:hypothetical protein